jgi:putative ABC transport system ATP-binding protein
MLRLHDVHKSFISPDGSRTEILRRADLEVERGESVALVGRSGSGKTTLLNILGLLDTPDSGSYEVNGRSVTGMADRDLSRLRGACFGFVFQDFLLLPRKNVLSNVALPLYHGSLETYRDRHSMALELLAAVGLQDKQRSRPSQLSGGEQQRVALARSLIRQPLCVLADEPTGALDIATGADMIDLLFRLVADRGRSLVIVTHDRAVAARADRVFELSEGRLCV